MIPRFRAFYRANKKMYTILIIDFLDNTLAMENTDNPKSPMTCYVDLGEVELMQFTGLKDKNGKEIFDGDILKIQTSDFYSKKINDEYISQVCFSRGGFFVLTDSHHTDFCLWGKSTATMEVIGNLYENPELLGVGHA